MIYHAVATLSGGRKKSIVNKSEDQMLTEFVIPYVNNGVIKAKWGKNTQSYQVLELRIFGTDGRWDKRSGVKLDTFLGNTRNRYASFEKRAKKVWEAAGYRVFIIMPIQGEKYGNQNQQRILKEYDARFEAIEKTLGNYDAVAIRIDREHTLDELVKRIKEEIEKSAFVIADLTEERPSCYFEAGYAEALKKPVIFIASKESVINPGTKTQIHFDIHWNINYFTNTQELQEKLQDTLEKNRNHLFLTSDA